MRLFTVAGILATATAMSSVVLAQDVTWTLTGTSAVSPGDPVDWEASVSVDDSDGNQGLAGYAFHIVVGPSPGPTAGPDGEWGTRDDENLIDIQLPPAAFVDSFQVQGSSPPAGTVADTGSAGGPGMNVLPQTGTNTLFNGELLQAGASYLAWAAYPGQDGQSEGVGLDGAKASLLVDPQGDYVLHAGTIPTTDLAEGNYTVMLIPVATRTLVAELNFDVDQPGFIAQAANATGGSFEFTISSAPPAAVPTSSQWSLMLLTVSLALFGALAIRRRFPAISRA